MCRSLPLIYVAKYSPGLLAIICGVDSQGTEVLNLERGKWHVMGCKGQSSVV